MFLLSNINVFLLMYYCGIVIGHTSPSDRWGMSKGLCLSPSFTSPWSNPLRSGKGGWPVSFYAPLQASGIIDQPMGRLWSIIEGYSAAEPSSWRECFNSQSAFAVEMPKLPWWVLYWDYLHPAPFKSLGCSTGLTSKYVMSLSDTVIYKKWNI